MKSAYVYYRIDLRQAGIAAATIDVLLDAMAVHCRLPPRRLVRCDDPATWMEIYEGIADFESFETALGAAAETHDCGTFTLGERHLECFAAGSSPSR